MNKTLLLATTAISLALGTSAMAQDHTSQDHHNHETAAGHIHDETAPMGVMGAHNHEKGKFMVSYRYRRMDMGGNRVGTNRISPEDIVTRFSANPASATGTNRVVPTQMTTDMHMVGAMYGLSDRITLMAMGSYIQREMDHVTFQGLAGTARRGEFTTRSSGFGDTTLAGIIDAYNKDHHQIMINAGLSVPTGSIKEQDAVLAPNGARPTLRLPYAMQLGTGTFDLLPGVTYTGHEGAWNWGAQYRAAIRLEDENSQGYRWGDRHEASIWGGRQFNPLIQGNARLSYETMDDIEGQDAQIAAPVQTADPSNYGGDIVQISAGFNLTPQHKSFAGQQLGFEVSVPIYQDLNGPQLERDFTITGGWRLSF